MPTDPSIPTSQVTPVSPCIRVCTLDDDRVCIGCGRHVDEISAWSLLSVQEQRSVLTRSEERRRRRKNSLEEVIGYGR